MQDKLTLMIPGPTPVPQRVLSSLSKHPIGHRSKEFQEIVKKTTKQLKWLHQTENDVLVITGSGTAAMEAGIINTLSYGDKVICGENGKFGERWVKVAKAYGLNVQIIKSNWGEPLDPEKFRESLEADSKKEIKAVIITHSETSTGIINNLKLISEYVNNHGKCLMIADCVTSLGACNVPMDQWKIDIIASGSQKGYMVPPGLSFVAMSKRAWAFQKTSNLPKFYLDLLQYQKASIKDSNPFTPSVNLYFALETALSMMQNEGLDNIFNRHLRHRNAIQAGIRAMGLKLFAPLADGSPAITSVIPEGIDAEIIRKVVKEKFDILLAGGQDHLKGKIFRIGHLGYVNDKDILSAISSIEASLEYLGKLPNEIGSGLQATVKALKY
tara:strand:+ start:2064 stop:3215 length:1152 start_codon:yes stop_codon:yes gene_type:complete